MPFFKDFAESTVYGHSHGADAMIPWWGAKQQIQMYKYIKFTNTNTQIHEYKYTNKKYTNTNAQNAQIKNTQIHEYRYTNTNTRIQIHKIHK